LISRRFGRVTDNKEVVRFNFPMRKPIAVVAVLAFTASSTFISSSEAASKPVVNPIPITLPVKPVGDITFANIEKRIADIPMAAYTSVQSVVSANAQPNISITVIQGPNTKLPINVKDALGKIVKLWSGFRQPVTYSALVYNYQDKAWALKADAKVPVVVANGGAKGAASMSSVIDQCAADNCGRANSGISDAKGNGYGQYQIMESQWDPNGWGSNGSVFGHEYTHSAQAAQFLGNANVGKPVSKDRQKYGLDNSPSGLFQGVLPCWMTEGMAQFNGPAVVAPTFDYYMRWRGGQAMAKEVPQFTDYSAKSLQNFFVSGTPPKCLPPAPVYEMGRTTGALAIEALAAIAGPQASMAVVTLMGRGQSYDTAFKNVYGISWAEAAPILARVVAAEYAATPK
jgi:hypothetical protein